MRPGTPGFVGARLREAREARGLTQAALSQILGTSRSAVYQYETGEVSPRPDVMARLPATLGVMPGYFFLPVVDEPRGTVFYRSMSSATAAARAQAERRFTWLKQLVDYLERFLVFPAAKMPVLDLPEDPRTITEDYIEQAAATVRRFWGLGDGPISNVTYLLENNGTVVCRVSLGAATLDAFSEWRAFDQRPYVVLGADKDAAARSRLDAAHELGHMVLHRHVEERFLRRTPEFSLLERQAFRFGGALLLPAGAFASDFAVPTLNQLVALKSKWNVSVGAMLVRAKDLGLLPEAELTRLWRSYARRGMKRAEPLDDIVPVERPALLRQAVTLLVENGIQSRAQLRFALPIGAYDLEELAGLPEGFFEDTPGPKMLSTSNEGVASTTVERSRADLRIVKDA